VFACRFVFFFFIDFHLLRIHFLKGFVYEVIADDFFFLSERRLGV